MQRCIAVSADPTTPKAHHNEPQGPDSDAGVLPGLGLCGLLTRDVPNPLRCLLSRLAWPVKHGQVSWRQSIDPTFHRLRAAGSGLRLLPPAEGYRMSHGPHRITSTLEPPMLELLRYFPAVFLARIIRTHSSNWPHRLMEAAEADASWSACRVTLTPGVIFSCFGRCRSC